MKVLTGSTNFSVTGLYVNSNHVLVFNDPTVAAKYAEVFEAAWQGNVKAQFVQPVRTRRRNVLVLLESDPKDGDHFLAAPGRTSPTEILDGMTARIKQEGKKGKATGSVLFAVMEVDSGTGPVYPALQALHADQSIFSYGISDTTSGISLYTPGKGERRLGDGQADGHPASAAVRPGARRWARSSGPPQVRGLRVQRERRRSSTAARRTWRLGGEESNGDNLIAIHDVDVATAFAIEALGLVDHFDFLDRVARHSGQKTIKPRFASKQQEALSVGWFLSTTDKWVEPYFDPNDLHSMDRQLFG